jgi:hypothetical protein
MAEASKEYGNGVLRGDFLHLISPPIKIKEGDGGFV